MEVRRFVFRRGVNMEDRISTYPGRIKLTAVTGEADTYDLTRADSPTVVGTPLNKATFLTDTTADAIEALGVTEPTLPDEALNAIASLLAGMGVSDVAHIEYGSYIGSGQHGSSHKNSLVLSYKPLFVIITKSTAYVGGAYVGDSAMWMKGTSAMKNSVVVAVNGTTFEWYTTSTVSSANAYQLNESGVTYYYFAVGEI